MLWSTGIRSNLFGDEIWKFVYGELSFEDLYIDYMQNGFYYRIFKYLVNKSSLGLMPGFEQWYFTSYNPVMARIKKIQNKPKAKM